MDLNGFVAYDFSRRTPQISVTNNGVTFNSGVTESLGKPEFAMVYTSEESRSIVIVPAESKGQYTKRYFSPKKGGVKNVRWNDKALNQMLYHFIKPGEKAPDVYAYRVLGESGYCDKKGAYGVLFDLKKAICL